MFMSHSTLYKRLKDFIECEGKAPLVHCFMNK